MLKPLHRSLRSGCVFLDVFSAEQTSVQATLQEMFVPAVVPATARRLVPGRRFGNSLTLADLRAELPEPLQRSLCVRTFQELQVSIVRSLSLLS